MTAPQSISVTAAALVALTKPASVLDLGSSGPWAEGFREAGVVDVVTVREPGATPVGDDTVVRHDLRLPFVADRRFDLAICIGGAADLPADAAATLVGSLTKASSVVAFAAPQPGLSAPGTPNPQWPAWWDSLFELHGLVAHDVLRVELWEDDRVDLLIRSLIVYAPAGRLPEVALPPTAVRSAVHPEVHYRAVVQSDERRRHEVARLNAALFDADVDAGGLRELVWTLRGELERYGYDETAVGSSASRDTRTIEWRLRSIEAEEQAAVLMAANNAERHDLDASKERLDLLRVQASRPGVALTRWASGALPIRRRLASVLGTPADLLDVDYYERRYPDVAASRFSPLWHYRRSGSRHRRSPHRLFDVDWYLERNPDVAAAGTPAVSHYLRHGWKDGRDPHPLFDGSWYAATHELGRWSRSPLEHYLEHGAQQGLSPHPLFDPEWYRNQNAESLSPGVDPFTHFDERGWKEGRSPHPLFDARWYLARNRGAVHAGVNPLEHYLRVGWRHGSDPSPMFDVNYYREVNAGVVGVDEEPLGHYVKHGAAARLSTSRLFDAAWYVRTHPEALASGNPLVYFVTIGARRGHTGAPEARSGAGYDRASTGSSAPTPLLS